MPQKVIVAGGTGFIGRPLVEALVSAGHEVVVLARRDTQVTGARTAIWDVHSLGAWASEVEGAAAVINLVGEPINQRWTPEARQRIVQSRTDSIAVLGAAIRSLGKPPLRWINASATGYYGNRGDEPLAENSPPGTGFLAATCLAWEQALEKAAPAWCPTCRVRIGVVLGRDGGALPTLSRLAKLVLGGPAGSGRQGMSWVHREDLVRLIAWLIEVAALPPVVNGTAPRPVSNRDFMAALRRAVRQPVGLPAPTLGVQVIGRLIGVDPSLVLEGAYVTPEAALRAGFTYQFPDVDEALEDLAGK